MIQTVFTNQALNLTNTEYGHDRSVSYRHNYKRNTDTDLVIMLLLSKIEIDICYSSSLLITWSIYYIDIIQIMSTLQVKC